MQVENHTRHWENPAIFSIMYDSGAVDIEIVNLIAKKRRWKYIKNKDNIYYCILLITSSNIISSSMSLFRAVWGIFRQEKY